MSQHTRGRHRAPSRLSSSVTTTARVSAAVAVSGGLIAAVAAPADATQAVGSLSMPKSASPKAATAPAVGGLVAHGVVQHGRPQLPAQEWARDLVRTQPQTQERRPQTQERSHRDRSTTERHSTPARTERTSTEQRTSRSAQRSAPKNDTTSTPAKKKSGGDSSSTASSSRIVEIAKRYIGTPYVYGGSTPSGFDCSGFTGYVYQQVGLSLPRSARAQQAAVTRVSDPRPGDLVFYNYPATHVMIYVGNGMVIDSPRPGKTVSIHKMWGSNISYGRLG